MSGSGSGSGLGLRLGLGLGLGFSLCYEFCANENEVQRHTHDGWNTIKSFCANEMRERVRVVRVRVRVGVRVRFRVRFRVR